ncbi:hypothetical protein OO013_13705 [Mangrovivirga sp. M17]|uniref:Fibronectin type-III domain-containing protein n=1 Tax=Mangrovivirga halotolerans TaxID=2993936 RepID=A0ABT3RTL6_9BACT|nr:hypothetical protein [Mangrovivirga halotolerans]MCX2744933.1 hypothetical protein [Mangrovivirga halotolerans]
MRVSIRIILLLLLSIGCYDHKEVTITKDFVINPNWTQMDNSFEIYKMKPKDSSKTINPKNYSSIELYHALTTDTSYSYVANVKYNGVDYAHRKVYFNRDNGFVWTRPSNIDPSLNSTFETIGEFERETWYLLAGLSQYGTLYYLYIDASDSLHVHKVSGMTNY